MNRTKLLLLEGRTKALDQLLTKQNIKAWFKIAKMHLFILKAMDDKIKTSSIYTTTIAHSEGESKNGYTSYDQVGLNQQWGE